MDGTPDAAPPPRAHLIEKETADLASMMSMSQESMRQASQTMAPAPQTTMATMSSPTQSAGHGPTQAAISSSAAATTVPIGGGGLPTGALFSAIFFPILIFAGLAFMGIYCAMRRRRRNAEPRERKWSSSSTESNEPLSEANAQPLQPQPTARQPIVVIPEYRFTLQSSPTIANDLGFPVHHSHGPEQDAELVLGPPPEYRRHDVSASALPISTVPLPDQIPLSPAPAYPQPVQLSQANLAIHGARNTRSPFSDPEPDEVSEVSDSGRRYRLTRDLDELSVVSGLSNNRGSTATETREIV